MHPSTHLARSFLRTVAAGMLVVCGTCAVHAQLPYQDAALPINTRVQDLLGRAAPGRMTDGRDPWAPPFERNHHPEDPVDAAIMATRLAVFPHWGLVADPFGGF